jgi:comEA protein
VYQGGVAGCDARIGFVVILIMEGNEMKSYLLLLALMFLVTTAGWPPAHVSAAEHPAAKVSVETIHLNQATAEQLQALPGVGPALSARIVSYRDEHGPFSSVDQLAEVNGIGAAKLAKLKDQLTVD